MKTHSKIPGWLKAVLFIQLFLIGSLAFGQPATPAPVAAPAAAVSALAAPQSLPDTIVGWLTPILVPLLLAAVKKIAPALPAWIIPISAPVLGFVIGLINNLATAHSGNLWLAAGLGLLGVAVREVKEAVAPAANGGWGSSTPPPAGGG